MRKMEERRMRVMAAMKESHRKEMEGKEQMMERKLAEQEQKIKVINYVHLSLVHNMTLALRAS